MATVQVRDVPEEVHKVLVKRAASAGQSLQQYLSAQLVLLAQTPSAEELFDEIERTVSGRLSTQEAVEALRVTRDSR